MKVSARLSAWTATWFLKTLIKYWILKHFLMQSHHHERHQRSQQTHSMCWAASCPSMCRWPSTSWPLVQRSPGFLCRCTRSHNPPAGSARCGSVRETPVFAQDGCFIFVTFQRRFSKQGSLLEQSILLQEATPAENTSRSSWNYMFMTGRN